MEGEDESSTNSRAFNNKSVWARISVVFAGPFFNFIMAFIFSFIILVCVGYDAPVIREVIPNYAADQAGMQSGDEILEINGKNIYFFRQVSSFTLFHAGEDIDLTYLRDGKKQSLTLKATYDEESGRYLYGFIGNNQLTKASVGKSFLYSFHMVGYWIDTTFQSLRMLGTGKASVNDLSGPVGIVKDIGTSYDESVKEVGYLYTFFNLLSTAIFLSANLGVMNLLPIPALDGGRLVFLIIEVIRRKKIDPDKEGMVHLVGIVLLLALMVFVMFNDIRKLLPM